MKYKLSYALGLSKALSSVLDPVFLETSSWSIIHTHASNDESTGTDSGRVLGPGVWIPRISSFSDTSVVSPLWLKRFESPADRRYSDIKGRQKGGQTGEQRVDEGTQTRARRRKKDEGWTTNRLRLYCFNLLQSPLG